jgi:O-antigen ligase
MTLAIGYYVLSFIIGLISPFWGLVGFTCSLLLRFQDHYPQIVAIKPFTLLLFGMILSCIINKNKLSKLVWKQDKLILYLLLLSILGLLIMSPGKVVSETYLFLCSISLYYFTSRIMQTPAQFITLFFCMGLSVAYLGYLAIEDINLLGLQSQYIDPRSNRWQGIGYYENSNEFGQLMITTIPFLLACILIRKSKILSAASIALMSLLLFVMVKCESRTVMVTLALMFVGTFMLRGTGNIAKKAIVGGCMSIVMLTVLTFMPGPLQERMGTILDAGNDESFQGRTRAWGYGFDMVSWYPFTGVGKGEWLEYHGLASHNSYVEVMAETGLPGIYLYLWTIWLCFAQFKPIMTNNHANAPPKTKEHLADENSSYGMQEPASGLFSFEQVASDENENNADKTTKKEINNTERTVAIAVLITFVGWLLYIFLGNQGFSVWTYFYLGLCCALGNFMPLENNSEDPVSIFNENDNER